MKLEDIGFLCVLTKEVIDECYLFTCGDDPDMDEFSAKMLLIIQNSEWVNHTASV